ncbi:hypothetical protein ACFVT2_16310 [Streptomyces sp. NPDC058000]|uniref:hypothetical protein n=1 Tax=Streptomyces sp. NPDC058000 TaxID=3346299 RepID=UPI0036E6313F
MSLAFVIDARADTAQRHALERTFTDEECGWQALRVRLAPAVTEPAGRGWRTLVDFRHCRSPS